jgi:L-ribulose-5-phosphate 3-epimerase
MHNISRRNFLEKSLVLGATGVIAPKVAGSAFTEATPRLIKDDISLAQWALVDEVKAGKWKTLDFARIARNDFGLNGIEFVNTLFEVVTEGYLKQLKKNAEENGVTMVLIMVDDEGDGCSSAKDERRQFEIDRKSVV